MPFNINDRFTPTELATYWSLGSWKKDEETCLKIFKPSADTIYRMVARGEIEHDTTPTDRILFRWSHIWQAMGIVSVKNSLPHRERWLEWAEKPLTLQEAAAELQLTPKSLAMRLGERKKYKRIDGRLPFFTAGARKIRILPVAIREGCI